MTLLPDEAQKIVDSAREATESLLVVLASYEREQDVAMAEAMSGLGSEPIRRAMAEIPRTIRNRIQRMSTRGAVNAASRNCYHEGVPTYGTFAEVAEGIAPAAVITVATRVAGIRHSLMLPLKVDGQVVGSLSFHTGREIAPRQRRICEAFARQAALTLEKARLSEQLEAQLLELEESRRLMVSAEERVRRDVAALLHGQVQTQLLVAWHRLGLCQELMERDPTGALELLVQVRDQLDQIREHDIREASHRLHPGILDVGLLPAVRNLVARFEDVFKLELTAAGELAAYDDPGDNRLSPDLRLAAYRVVEEALGNAAKHAGASRVRVRLEVSGGELVVTVADDGRGIDTKAIREGLGLRSIAQHVGAMGGIVRVGNLTNGGVEVRARFPLETPASVRPPEGTAALPG